MKLSWRILCTFLLICMFDGSAGPANAELTLDVIPPRQSTTEPLVISVSGEGSCPEVTDPVFRSDFIEIAFSDFCPILPPDPSPFEHFGLLGPLEPGIWEIWLFDFTVPISPPPVVATATVTVVDPRYSLELMPSPASAADEVVATIGLFETNGCSYVESIETENEVIRINVGEAICDPPDPGSREAEVSLGQLEPGEYLVELYYVESRVMDAQLIVLPEKACASSESVLCLNDGRFRVEAEWTTVTPESGAARAVSETDESGFFWFFSPDNIELVVKVLDGCATPVGNFWVFAAGLTDTGVVLTVTDTTTGEVVVYQNQVGNRFETITDTAAFDSCSAIP